MKRHLSGYERIKEKLTLQEKKTYDDILYLEYMSSEESDYEDEEDPITGETVKRLVGYATRKLPWERTRQKNLKCKLDKVHVQNCRHVGGVSSRPRPGGPSWAVRQPPADE